MTNVDVHDLRFKALYLRTAREYVDKLTINLHTLLEGNMDTALYTEIRINAHSLKGQSAVCGYIGIQDISFLIETVAKEVIEGEKIISTKQIHTILSSLADISTSLNEIDNADQELDLSETQKNLTEVLGK